MTEEDELAEVEKWFATLGHGMIYVTDRGFTWAHLTRLQDRIVVAPKYGRGNTRIEAARRAKQRYEVEQ